MLDSVRYMSVDINVCLHHVLRYQSVTSLVTYRTTTWQQGKEVLNAFICILDLDETSYSSVQVDVFLTVHHELTIY